LVFFFLKPNLIVFFCSFFLPPPSPTLNQARDAEMARERAEREAAERAAEAAAAEAAAAEAVAAERAARAAEEHAQRVERLAAEAGARLGPEPEAGGDVTTLAVRLPDGTAVRRRFPKAATVASVLDFVASRGIDAGRYVLTTPMPRTVHDDLTATLEAAGLMQCQVVLEEREA
jgi:multidrug efflux pump subunit AcrA (membrane-fusion protein)